MINTDVQRPTISATKMVWMRSPVRLWLSLLIGILFLLPQLVRMADLHSVRDYSPFSARSSSPTTIDETFLYAAEVNYTYRQHRLANDTDAWEHRNQPVPYSLLPAETEVAIARLFHSVAAAQIFCYFLFPAITAWLLMGIFLDIGASMPLSALLALVTLVASFSLHTWEIGLRALLVHGMHSGFIETLQASRNFNPNMTFPLFLGALLALIAVLRRRSMGYAVLAGLLGGLLFFSYVYYAIAWAAAVAFLALIALLRKEMRSLPLLAVLSITICLGAPFLLWVHAAKKAGGYLNRIDRLGAVYSHLPSVHNLKLTAIFALCLALFYLAWRLITRFTPRSDAREESPGVVLLVLGCAAAGGVAGLNMQILTGFDLQDAHHFPHMVIQPMLVLMVLVLALTVASRLRLQPPRSWATALFLLFFMACAAIQTEAAVNSAPLHRIVPSERVLFQWLNHHTRPGDVVATTSLELAVYMPVYSQDYTLIVDGSRTSATDNEILDRYLLAEALTSTPEATVASELDPPVDSLRTLLETRTPWHNYPSFFFEHSPDLGNHDALKPELLQKELDRYRTLDVADDLKRFRVNYLYTENGQRPDSVPQVTWQKVLTTSNGTLWRLDWIPEQGSIPHYPGITK